MAIEIREQPTRRARAGDEVAAALQRELRGEVRADAPVLRQYSKAPELSFPPEERAARLAQSRRDNREEISKGLAWLDRLARADGSIAALLAQGAA